VTLRLLTTNKAPPLHGSAHPGSSEMECHPRAAAGASATCRQAHT
jgi:hypothetical protein